MTQFKFYYAPGTCALASHIVLEEVGAAFEPVRLAFAKNEQRTPEYLKINPKGRVPALVEGDWALTENPAILRYVARRFPEAGLWPEDARAEARCAEWLAWIASTVHVAYAHIRRPERYASDPKAIEDVIAKGKDSSRDLWGQVEAKLGAGPWALGDAYSVADPYLLTLWVWGRNPPLAIDMARDLPNWTAHARRMAERPAVRRAFEREGLELPA